MACLCDMVIVKAMVSVSEELVEVPASRRSHNRSFTE